MTINSEVRKAGPFTGNDTTTVFPFTFKVFTADQVGVVLTNDSGNERYAVQGTEYTVTLNPDQNTSPGGLVQIPAPLATGDLLTITSHVPYLQHLDLTNQGGFYPATINQALDRATIQIQQLAEQVDRSVKTPVSSGSTPEALVNELLTGANVAKAGANVAKAAAERATESANYVASQEGNIATVVANIPQLQAVSDKLGQIVSRDDYDTDAAFAAAGRQPTQRLNQVDLYTAGSAGQQMYASNHGLISRSTTDNVVGAIAVSPKGDVKSQRSATSLLALFHDDIETNPAWRKFNVEMHYDPDNKYRGRLTTRIQNTSLKHVDYYWQFGGQNVFYAGNAKDSGNGTRVAFSFWPRGYTFGSPGTPWQSGEAVAVGEERRTTFCDYLKLVCTVAGVTGSVEPRPVTTRATYSDGTATWVAVLNLTGTSNSLPSLWLDRSGNVGFHVIDPAYTIQFGARPAFNAGIQFLDSDNTARARVENVYHTNQNLTFGSVPAHSAIEKDISMPGVIPGDSIILSPSYNVMQSGLLFNAYVRQNGLVRVMCHNYSAEARTVSTGAFVIVVMRVYQ